MIIPGARSNSHKYARVEAERRFLLHVLPPDLAPHHAFVRIIDHYLQGTRLRLRRIETPEGEILVRKLGQKYQLPGHASHQTLMTNLYLSPEEYDALTVLGGAVLTKRRIVFPYGRGSGSLDVFEGHLEGLILFEVEEQPGQDLTRLPVPAFAVREVTTDVFFSGGTLAFLAPDAFQQWLEDR